MDNFIQKKNCEYFKFVIKGDHLERFDSTDPYKKLLFPYFISKVNVFILFSSPTDKRVFFNELVNFLKNCKYLIITDDSVDTVDTSIDEYDHIIYYNSIPKSINSCKHISIIIDYTHLIYYKPINSEIINYNHANPNWYKELTNYISHEFLRDSFTLICQNPGKQNVDFVFSQTDELKYDTVAGLDMGFLKYFSIEEKNDIKKEKNTYIYSIDNIYKKLENFQYIDRLPKVAEYSDIVIADFNLEILKEALSRFKNITIIYTPKDFVLFKNLIDLCKLRNIILPEYIINIHIKFNNRN